MALYKYVYDMTRLKLFSYNAHIAYHVRTCVAAGTSQLNSQSNLSDIFNLHG